MSKSFKMQIQGSLIHLLNSDKKTVLRQHWAKGSQHVEPSLVTEFIQALYKHDTEAVKQLIMQHGKHLATLHGNYFPLPLHLAGGHGDLKLMNYLIEKGACPYKAIRHPQFKGLPLKAKCYLKSLCEFSQRVLSCLH